MWPRVVEIVVGAWLVASPWVLTVHPGDGVQLAVDVTAGVLAVGFALASLRPATRRAHLLTIAVAAGLVGWGWPKSASVAFSAYQHDILVGLILMMFAVIPVNTSVPPVGWRFRLSQNSAPEMKETR